MPAGAILGLAMCHKMRSPGAGQWCRFASKLKSILEGRVFVYSVARHPMSTGIWSRCQCSRIGDLTIQSPWFGGGWPEWCSLNRCPRSSRAGPANRTIRAGCPLPAWRTSGTGPLEAFLRRLMPDSRAIRNPEKAPGYRSLELEFSKGTANLVVPFSELSSGEKCYFVGALVLAAKESGGASFCFWDEPDSHWALSEVGDLTIALRKAFGVGGQFIATSHNPETIRHFSLDNTLLLYRRSHLAPTQVRPLSELEVSGDVGDIAHPGRPGAVSANRYLDHVIVLPEDAANHNIATGFKQEIPADRQTTLQILPAAGWMDPGVRCSAEQSCSLDAQVHQAAVGAADRFRWPRGPARRSEGGDPARHRGSGLRDG